MSLIAGKFYNYRNTKFSIIMSPFEMPLIPGKLYNFKSHPLNGSIMKGIFLGYSEHLDMTVCMFELFNSPYRLWLANLKILKFIINTEPIFAKQVARGLCDRIPEDCAGIIERMLIGDRIVGQGPDRYPERH